MQKYSSEDDGITSKYFGDRKRRSLIFSSQISKKIKVKLDHEGSGWAGNKEQGC